MKKHTIINEISTPPAIAARHYTWRRLPWSC